jgi:hypothetical protein
VVVKKQTIFNEESVHSKMPSNVPESNLISQRNNSTMVSEFWKGKMVEVMCQLQEIGVKSYQHIKRPYLFTGSWLEGVTNIEQLYDRVKGITSNEAMLRLFNILYPYEGAFPQKDKEEVAVSQFYGEYYNFDVPKETRVVRFPFSRIYLRLGIT